MSQDVDVETGEIPPYRDHQGPASQYLRDIILGVNDGLVSIFLLVAGVVGGGFNANQVLLAGVAAALAGAVSMAAGEYLATKSQAEVLAGEIELEKEHLKYHRDREVEELREMFGDMGLKGDLLEQAVAAVGQDDEAIMRIMVAFEFGGGVEEVHGRSPFFAMIMSGGLFLLGSLPSLLPFVFFDSVNAALAVAAVAASIALFFVGVLKTRMTRGDPIKAGFENLVVSTVGAFVSYGVGSGVEALIN